jgi:peptidoglycan hydrolase-like protein with peptidoglycan-binding domain
MSEDIPSHRRGGGRRGRRLVAAGLVSVTLTGVAAGCSEADSPPLVGPDEQATEADAGGRPRTAGAGVATTASPTAPTTAPATVPSTTTTAPTTTVPATTTTTAPPDPADDGMLELGEAGDSVSALQQRLTDLGYWLGTPDGSYGQLTRQAVMAFQKAEGLGRDGMAGPETQGRLATAGRPVSRAGGTGIEIDLARQVLFVVQGGQVRWAFNTSTGSGEAYTGSSGGSAIAATPPGQFAIQRQIDGYREAPLGTLYRPKYFNGGIAVHGSGSIPATPASHGCARLTNAAMDLLWSSGVAEIGTTVTVY